MNTGEALRILSKDLKNDPGFRESWKATIAMAYKDNWHWYSEKTGKTVMNKEDRHIISNNAADTFLDMLCMETEEKPKTFWKEIFG